MFSLRKRECVGTSVPKLEVIHRYIDLDLHGLAGRDGDPVESAQTLRSIVTRRCHIYLDDFLSVTGSRVPEVERNLDGLT